MSFKAPSCLKRQLEIRLNVYDLIEANKYGAGAIGAFHSGCVIDGIEYSYGLNDYDPPRTGVWRCKPQCAPGFMYRDTIQIGTVSMSMDEVEKVLDQMRKEWMGNDYDLVNRNCNHFTNELCIKLCDKKIPRWINRLARWGASLSSVFGRPEALGPERWTPDSVRADNKEESEDTVEVQDESEALTEEQECIIAEVVGGLSEVLTSGVKNVAMFARLVESMCWGFSAAELTNFLSADTLTSHKLPKENFMQLAFLANHAIVTYAAAADYGCIRRLLEVSQRIHTLEEDGTPRMMIRMLRKHAFWHDSGLWSGVFYEGFTAMVLRSQIVNPGDKADEIQQYAFAELTHITHAMSALGLTSAETARFLYTMKAANMLDSDQYSMLTQLSERGASSPSNHKPHDPLYGGPQSPPSSQSSALASLLSPRSTTKRTQSSVNTFLVSLLQHQTPETMDELMSWIDSCNDMSSVRGFARQLSTILEGCQQHHLETCAYYVLSAILSRCLTTCEAMRDYADARSIMHAALVLQGPTMGAKSMSQELTLDGANNLDGSPPEHMANLDCVDISMSRSICRHAIWHSSAYWVYVLEQNFNESATQLHQNDDDPSEVRFVHLNKVVQLMLTLQVPKSVVANMIQESLLKFKWSEDYEPMCEHLLQSIREMSL